MTFDFNAITNQYLRAHLAATDNTEPPQLFHVWTAISMISACMGRHLVLKTGIGNIFGNQYILLVGPPGTRKGTAMKFGCRVLKKAKVKIRFAPDDTSGQRQGLITAMKEDNDMAGFEKLDLSNPSEEALENLFSRGVSIDSINRHVMFVYSPEFGSFLGQNNTDFTRFLIKMWDGDDYSYKLRKSADILESPLLSLIGGTTTQDIVTLMPPEAIGQGFMSRFVLVYQPYKRQRIRIDQAYVNQEFDSYFCEIFENIWSRMRGEMELEDSAADLLAKIGDRDSHLTDSRFIYYHERRETHLIKLAMALAASEQTMSVTDVHVSEADYILSYTELFMPDAMGEYGLSPVSVAKQKMLEFLRAAREPVTHRVLWIIMSRDIKLTDFAQIIESLVTQNRVEVVTTKDGKAYVYKDKVTRDVHLMSHDEISDLFDFSTNEVKPNVIHND